MQMGGEATTWPRIRHSGCSTEPAWRALSTSITFSSRLSQPGPAPVPRLLDGFEVAFESSTTKEYGMMIRLAVVSMFEEPALARAQWEDNVAGSNEKKLIGIGDGEVVVVMPLPTVRTWCR